MAGDVPVTAKEIARRVDDAALRLVRFLWCGNDGTVTTCVDSRNQSGFVLSPAGSFILNTENPLLDRPEGTNPYTN